MTPESSLAAAEAARRTEERKTPHAETVKTRLDQARDENDLARLFRHAFNAGRLSTPDGGEPWTPGCSSPTPATSA